MRTEETIKALEWLEQVSSDELSEMCDEFRSAVFKKAGKKDPKEEK